MNKNQAIKWGGITAAVAVAAMAIIGLGPLVLMALMYAMCDGC